MGCLLVGLHLEGGIAELLAGAGERAPVGLDRQPRLALDHRADGAHHLEHTVELVSISQTVLARIKNFQRYTVFFTVEQSDIKGVPDTASYIRG